MRIAPWALLTSILVSLPGCGHQDTRSGLPSAGKAQARAALDAFAKRYSAVVVESFDSDSLESRYSAQVQEEIQDTVVAFRADLLDVVYSPATGYYLELSDLLGDVIVRLEASPALARQVMAQPRHAFDGVLVVARIANVVPLSLGVGATVHSPEEEGEESVAEVEVSSNEVGLPRIMTGTALALERER